MMILEKCYTNYRKNMNQINIVKQNQMIHINLIVYSKTVLESA